MPPWVGAPRGVLPGVVALELVIARTSSIAVAITRLDAYPSGFALDLVTMADQNDDELDPALFEGRRLLHRRGEAATGEIPNQMLRFGLEFADGRKATNVAESPLLCRGSRTTTTMHAIAEKAPDQPAGPVLNAKGGSGGSGEWRQSFWVWPLPPPGPLTFACEWPAAHVPLARHEIDAHLILEATSRAQVIFAQVQDAADGNDQPEL
jgi:hypothetical protein